MADYETSASIPELIRSLLDDTRVLIREELALAQAEIREELSTAQTVALAFGSAALAAAIGAVLLAVALGGAIAYFLNWPAWTGYAIVAVLLFAAGYFLVRLGRNRLARVRALPQTTATVKENLAWIQSKSAQR
jgi:integral membrane sensor domain MASE1